MLFRGAPLASAEMANYAGGMEAGPTPFEEFAAETRERFTRIETRLDQTATKADLFEEIGGLRSEMHQNSAATIKWVVGTAVMLGATGITVMTFA